MSDVRVDPWLGTLVHVVASRQNRPNLPSTGCPFCVGGLEAPEPYTVKAIPNRWPPMPDDRCEVVLYTSDHQARLSNLPPEQLASLINLWADRTAALGARDDVDFVLVFENSGRAVGATIDHPHGQIYAFDHVPDRSRKRIAAGWKPDESPERLFAEREGWIASVPLVSAYPVAVEIAPRERIPDLPSMNTAQRSAFGAILQDVLRRVEKLYGEPAPTMMWFNQRPTVSAAKSSNVAGYDTAWFNVEIVSPWRSSQVMRYIAAAEVATGEYFIPVVPEDLAARLRAL
ncbi:MAG: galactose-phosphate uridylyltransferase [Actinomycetota bacterium]